MLMLYPSSCTTGVGSVTHDKSGVGRSAEICLVKVSWQQRCKWLHQTWTCGPGDTLVLTGRKHSKAKCHMWLEWLILKKTRQGRQQTGHARRQQLMEFPKTSCAKEASCHCLPLRAVLGDLPFQYHPGWSLSEAQPMAGRKSRELLLTEYLQSKAVCYSLYRYESSKPPKIPWGRQYCIPHFTHKNTKLQRC